MYEGFNKGKLNDADIQVIKETIKTQISSDLLFSKVSDPNEIDYVRSLLKIKKIQGQINNYKDKDGNTLLHRAASNPKNIKIVKELLKRGANIRSKNKDGNTPLHIAVKDGGINIVKVILEQSEIDEQSACIKNHESETPLHYAIRYGNIKSIPDLVRLYTLNKTSNKDLSYSRNKDDDIFAYAVKNGVLKALDDLITNAIIDDVKGFRIYKLKDLFDINKKDKDGFTALHQAVKRGDVNIIKKLISQGASLNIEDAEQRTLFEYAIEHGNQRIINLLLNNYLDSKSHGEETTEHAIFHAIETANTLVIDYLVKDKSVLQKKNTEGMTPLYCAVANKNIKIANLLIEKGADITVTDNHGRLSSVNYNDRLATITLTEFS